MKYTMLIVEDEENLAFGIKSYLERRNFIAHRAGTVEEAKLYLAKTLPSLVIIDWNLPDGNGGNLCQWIKNKWTHLPIIFLTVRGDTKDMLLGFQIGADDYIVKPFDLAILLSRISAILRRTGNVQSNHLLCGPITLDKCRTQVFYEKEEIMLSALEYQLLLILMENKNHTLPRNLLLEKIWDANGNFVNDNTLTVTMKRLREKLHSPACIKTIRSLGYRLEDE